MTIQDRTVIELIVMSQTKYFRELALLTVDSDTDGIDKLWEEQKKTLAKIFQGWNP